MKSALLTIVGAVLLAGLGCSHNVCQTPGLAGGWGSSCSGCGGGMALGRNSGCGSCGLLANRSNSPSSMLAHRSNSQPTRVARIPRDQAQQQGPSGPTTATYGYPYYTTRAPRDFLLDNPPGIGY